MDTLQMLDNITKTDEDNQTNHCIVLILIIHSSLHVPLTVELWFKTPHNQGGIHYEEVTMGQVLL
jgi:hypothetical protein